MPAHLSELAQLLYHGDAEGVARLTRQGLEAGLSASTILNQGLMTGMDRVGQDFRAGNLFIPEIVVAARAMHAGIEALKPHLGQGTAKTEDKVVLGTVKGDLHDIGKKLVGIMLQGAGFEVIDLGHNVSPEQFVLAIEQHKPHLVGMSALLSTTMPMMKTTLEIIAQAGLRSGVRVLVGGAPVNQAWADQIGADGYAPDAMSAVDKARALLTP
jgi:5-methyltetrahydrofolate--homocysteine methyltransferase